MLPVLLSVLEEAASLRAVVSVWVHEEELYSVI